jgi:hypothetical protein
LYTKIQQAGNKYQSDEKEYTVDCVLNKASAKQFKKAFPKNSCKEHNNADFLNIFKVSEVPYPAQEEQYVVKFKCEEALKGSFTDRNTGTQYEKGDPLPYSMRPKVFLPVEGEPNSVRDVTLTTQVGNGSKGHVSFKILSNQYGTFPQLQAIKVEELVEYEGGSGGSPFGTVIGGEPEVQPTPVEPKAPSKIEENNDDDDDDDNPFGE